MGGTHARNSPSPYRKLADPSSKRIVATGVGRLRVIEIHRTALAVALTRKGFPERLIGLTVFALHPFDDQPVPPRKMEKKVRRLSKDAASALRRTLDGHATVQEWESVALLTLEAYVSLSCTYMSIYHERVWRDVMTRHVNQSPQEKTLASLAAQQALYAPDLGRDRAQEEISPLASVSARQVPAPSPVDARPSWVSFPKAVQLGTRRAFDYRRRASRSEFWWMWLFVSVIYSGLAVWNPGAGSDAVVIAVLGAGLVIQTSLLVRRMHDIGLSGWWLLLVLPLMIVVVGIPLFLALMTLPSTGPTSNYLWCREVRSAANRWGVLG